MKLPFSIALLLLCATSFAQKNEWPLIGLNDAFSGNLYEVGDNYYLLRVRAGGIRPNGFAPRAYQISKYNYRTQTLVKSTPIIGDTLQTDSILVGSGSICIGKNNDIIYYSFNRYYFDHATSAKAGMAIVVFAIDTNLNVVLSPRTIKYNPEPHDSIYGWCQLQNLCIQGSRLFFAYQQGNLAKISVRTSCIATDLQGRVLRDTVMGLDTLVMPGIRHQVSDLVAMPDGTLMASGPGIGSAGIGGDGFLLMDSQLHTIDTFFFKPRPYFRAYDASGDTIGDYEPRFPNFLALPSGSLITGAGFYVKGNPSNFYDTYNCIAKLRKISRYSFDVAVRFLSPTPHDNFVSGPGMRYLNYNAVDNRIYYASVNATGYINDCSEYQNYVHVISVDTNLRNAWVRFLTPLPNTCAHVNYSIAPTSRSGIDVMGTFFDMAAPTDSSRLGKFLFHVDSAGFLDVAGQQFFSARDRFKVYPNPSDGYLIIDDIYNDVSSVSIYNTVGSLVVYDLSRSNPSRIPLKDLPSGNYLLMLHLKDGTVYHQMFTHKE